MDKKIFKLLDLGDKNSLNAALSIIYDRYGNEIIKSLKKIDSNINNDTCLDLVQKSILIFWKKYNEGEFKKIPGGLSGFLVTVANRIHLKNKKSQKMIPVTHLDKKSIEDLADMAISSSIKEVEELRKEKYQLLWKCLNRLSMENKEIIMKYYFENRTGEELVNYYKQTLNWVNQRLYQNRLRLKKCIETGYR